MRPRNLRCHLWGFSFYDAGSQRSHCPFAFADDYIVYLGMLKQGLRQIGGMWTADDDL